MKDLKERGATKLCPNCETKKSVNEFYKNKPAYDGLCHICKKCFGILYHDTQRKRYASDHYRVWKRAYSRKAPISKNRIEKDRLRAIRNRKQYPAHIVARQILNKAIKSGEIVRPSRCSDCRSSARGRDGRTLIQGHHHDYSKPLDVEWICCLCHNKKHRALKESSQ